MNLPTIVIGKTDRERLMSAAKNALTHARPVPGAVTLLGEIARARTVSNKLLPTDVVAMHRQIEIKDNVRKTKRQLCLVYPDENVADSETVSVLTPMGAALIGLSEGDSIEWCSAAGDRHSITVLRVWPGAMGIVRAASKPKRG
jgi:regulator of nucleoside diphosphate kinase